MIERINYITIAGQQLIVEFTSNKERELWKKWWEETGYLDFKAWRKVVEELADE